MKRRTLAYYLLSLVMGSTAIISCSGDRDKLSRDKMVAVLHDIQLAEAVYQTKYNDFNSKEQKDALILGVLEKHGITQAELDSSLVWYADNAEIYMRVNDSVISSLKEGLVKIEKTIPRGLGTSNINNSILPAYYSLSEDIPTLTFDIDSTQVKNYPQFSLEFNTLGFYAGMQGELEICFEYTDTTIIQNQLINKNDYFKIVGDTLPLKTVSGYFHIDSRKGLNNKVLLYNIRLKNIEAAKDTTVTKSDLSVM